MAKLEYDETGRLLFTQEMRKEYTILIPQMLPSPLWLLRQAPGTAPATTWPFSTTTAGPWWTSGLKYVHNDACYPALLVIGQMIDAIQNGGYDPHKVALLITQTGGGCRASNYIHMLRKALEKAGLDYIPVLSLSFGLEKNPGFHWTVGLIRRLIYGMMYGDLIMNVANQVRPYEVSAGDTDRQGGDSGPASCSTASTGAEGMSRKKMRGIFEEICADFKSIPVTGEEPRSGWAWWAKSTSSSPPWATTSWSSSSSDEGAGTGGARSDRLSDLQDLQPGRRREDLRRQAGPSRPCASSSWDMWRSASWT